MTAGVTQPRILIAEDELIVAENIARHLRHQGYEVVAIVDSGEAAISEVLQLRPDLILMDIMLQGEIDGVQATVAISAQRHIPVIYMTAYADDETLDRAKVTEPYGYLVKPFKPHDLKTSIEVALQKYQADLATRTEYAIQLRQAEEKLNHLTTLIGLDGQDKTKEQSHLPIVQDVALEADLCRALEQHEFYLLYQPRVALNSGCITGAEALIRWHHPQQGLVSPTQFIPLAEATGLIDPLGEWVLQTACHQLQSWQQAGLKNLTVAVNLSGYQLKQPHFAQQISRILQETGLDPQFIELELTESMLIEDIELASRKLQGLKDMGLQIAMDDFGTGYSCLSHLHRLPFDTLKLDRSFVCNIDRNSKNGAIAIAIISMSRQLNLRVVAEGVETQAELDFLREHDCDEMQGFLFSHPLSASEFAALAYSEQRL